MLRFQLPIAATLVVSAFTSGAVIAWSNRKTEGKIQLPVHSDVAAEDDHYARHDPLDVTTPEDLVDGYPIEEDAFWQRVGGNSVFHAPKLILYRFARESSPLEHY